MSRAHTVDRTPAQPLRPRGRPARWHGAWCLALLVVAWALVAAPARADDSLVAPGSTWRFLDDGSDPGVVWRLPAFPDGGWQLGAAELGYGDSDETTVVGFGPDPANKFITTYFRHTFAVADASDYPGLQLRLKRDDGAVVYLNGVEILRDNMPAGPITSATLAASTVGGAAESTFFEFVLLPTLLVDGPNVLAVEVHQALPQSSDVSFDLELIGVTTTSIVRGPYLQQGTPTGVVVRWRTSVPTTSRVQVGPAPGVYPLAVDDPTLQIEHEVAIDGLLSATTYFYTIGTTAVPLAGGDADHRFRTSPTPGTAPPMRVWVIGDSGTANADARQVRDAYLAFNGGAPTDAWLMLGDNAYPIGTDTQYQAAVFDTYPTILRNTVLWPTLGNHDAEPLGVSTSNETGPYFDMFTLPDAGQAGGLASGTEAYYSFDLGNAHFINLNSTGSDRSPGGAMLTWLENDLASTEADWIIAYFHHPPYTGGSHNSDDANDSGGRMFDMREHALPILEAGGVDLVLSGHSHSYERSVLVDSHYGVSTTLTEAMKVDDGDGRETGDGVYRKQPRGTVYAVAGSSGTVGGVSFDHPVMFIKLQQLGSMVLDIDGGRLDASFLAGGGVADSFTLVKSPDCLIEMSQPSYTTGDLIEATSFRIRNPGPTSAPMEIKAWLDIPQIASELPLFNLGADAMLSLPSGFDLQLGPLPLLNVVPGLPAGEWELGCRVVDPTTGKTLGEDPMRFDVTP